MPVRPGRVFLLILFWLCTSVRAEVPVPELKARVTDQTDTLSVTNVDELDAALQDLEARSGTQLAILLVATTRPEGIEQYSMRVVERWKLGRKDKDNGILLLVAKNDRKVRMEVGYGLEGTIPDAVARRIVDETISPRFKEGDFAGGLNAGVQRVAALLLDQPGKDPTVTAPGGEDKPAAPGPHGIPRSNRGLGVTDLTGTLSEDQTWAFGRELSDFYDSGRTKPAFIVVVPTVKPDEIVEVASHVLRTWGEEDNLDVDRSILLLIAKDDGRAVIVAGDGLNERILPGAREKLIAEVIEPKLRSDDLGGAVESGLKGLETLIDDAISNVTFGERVLNHLAELPIWLIVVLIAIGTGLRWLFGPLWGASVSAGMLGGGAWFVSGQDMTIALMAAAVAFIFVLVGLANWLQMLLEGALSGGGGGGGGGSSGGGGFSGGGGSFGGGGASGSW